MPPRINANMNGAAGNDRSRIAYPITPKIINIYKSNVLKLTPYTPTMQKMRIRDINMPFGMYRIFAMYGIKGKFNINSMTLPIYILAIHPRKHPGDRSVASDLVERRQLTKLLA